MSQPLVSDALWAVIEPLLPPEPLKLKGGRPRVPDRAALMGILFVLRSGIPWEMLPQETGCGSGMTCWRRLREWQQAGVWERLQRVLLDRLGRRNAIHFRRAALDSASVAAKRGLGDRSQPDRPRQGGHQASHPHRCARHPTRSPADGGQRPRQRRAGRGRRCRPAHPAVLGTTSTKARQTPRRQGLRSSPLPSGSDPPPHPAPHRPTWHRKQRKARAAQMGRGTDAGVVQPVPPPRDTLRAQSRHPPRLHDTRRSPHHVALRQTAPLLRPQILQATSPGGGIEVSERAVSQSPFCGAQRRPLAPQRSWRMRQQPRRLTSGSP